jgi:hypothetical protein
MSFFLRLNDRDLPGDESALAKARRREGNPNRDWHESSFELQQGLDLKEFFDTLPAELVDLEMLTPKKQP